MSVPSRSAGDEQVRTEPGVPEKSIVEHFALLRRSVDEGQQVAGWRRRLGWAMS